MRSYLKYCVVCLCLLHLACGWTTRRSFVRSDESPDCRIGGCGLGIFLLQEESRGDFWRCGAFIAIDLAVTGTACAFGIDSLQIVSADVLLPADGKYMALTPDASPVSQMPTNYAPTLEVPKGAKRVVCRVFVNIPAEDSSIRKEIRDFDLVLHERKEPFIGE